MAKRKKQNLKLDIQEIMDRTAKSERQYRETHPICAGLHVDHVSLNFTTHHSDLTADNVIRTQEELEERINVERVLAKLVEDGAFTKEQVREGQVTISRPLFEAWLKQERRRALSVNPPRLAEYLAYVFLPRRDRETLLGDLTEEYPSVLAKFGSQRALIYFYKQVVWSIWPLLRKTAIKWGLFGWVVELIRKIGS